MPRRTSTMTRAQRLATFTAIFATFYFLVLFSILPVPFISEETVKQVAPVVSLLLQEPACLLALTSHFANRFHGGCSFLSARMHYGRWAGTSSL